MLRHFRNVLVAIAVAGLLGTAGPAQAGSFESEATPSDSPPMMIDVMLLRPVGLGMTVLGGMLFVPAAALTAVTRPSELGKPLELFVMKPVRFTFARPLGEW